MVLPGLVIVGAVLVSGCQPDQKSKDLACLSSWNGSSSVLIDAVKKQLRDPGSFEHIETLHNAKERDVLLVKMKYRARNGFGGMNVETAYGKLNKKTCDLLALVA